MKLLYHNTVWDLVDLSKDRKSVGSKRVYKVETGSEGLNNTKQDWLLKIFHKNTVPIMIKHSVQLSD